ncbi:MAG: hypothetical protein ACP5IO_04320 [Elusimicrobiales bacterium]
MKIEVHIKKIVSAAKTKRLALFSLMFFLSYGFVFGYSDFEYWFNRGYEAKDSDMQIEYYTKAINAWTYSDGDKNLAISYFNRGIAYTTKGEYDRAISD